MSNTSQKLNKYNLLWDYETTDLEIEFWMIRKGEAWLKERGRSLFFHYKEAQKLLWPEEDHHRWSDLILEEIIKNDITALQGAKDSGKTHGMCKYGLTDYFAHPDETLIIVSSTDIRSLEGRVWGDIKAMFVKAHERHPWLPGNILDSKHALCTDNLDDETVIARDMRKGILCFVAGTMVDSPTGRKPIESIAVGDKVFNALGIGTVTETFQRTADSLARITLKDGRQVVCTPEHKVFTNNGWVKACNLNQHHFMMSSYESMQILQRPNPEQMLLFRELQREAHADRRIQEFVLYKGEGCENSSVPQKDLCGKSRNLRGDVLETKSKHEPLHERAEQGPKSETCRPHEQDPKGARAQTKVPWRERHWTYKGRESSDWFVSTGQVELSDQNRREGWKRIPNLLQGGFGVPKPKAGSRSGRLFSSNGNSCGSGREEEQTSVGAWVDRVEIYQPPHTGGHGGCEAGVEVYNLEVSGHPSYSVNGLLVHNCIPCKTSSGGQTNISAYIGMKQKRRRYLADEFAHMSLSMYESLGNANSGDFKMVVAGNPIGQGDPLDLIAEPVGGWLAMPEPEKTAVWDNMRFLRSRTINLVGTDSPNFDQPQTPGPRYRYMTSQDSIDRTVAGYGKDSHQYYSQCKGVRRSGLNARRVITRELCVQHHAYDQPTWEGEPPVKIFGLDAAYGGIGGDRCIGGHIEFGRCMDGHVRLLIHPWKLVPVSVKRPETPEDQIAVWTKQYCESNGILPENCFYDSTGRGSLGLAFARLFSSKVNPVEFGGVPTERPVSLDVYVFDEKERTRRLKKCSEHYRKFVTELWWSLRIAIESDQMRGMTEEIVADGCMREWKEVAGAKIEVEPKEDTKLRMGKSPDIFDWVVTCIEGARRKGFQITKLSNETAKSTRDDWLSKTAVEYKQFLKGRQLQSA